MLGVLIHVQAVPGEGWGVRVFTTTQVTDATKLQFHDTTFSHDLRPDGSGGFVGGYVKTDAVVRLDGFHTTLSKFSNLSFLTPKRDYQALRSDVGLSTGGSNSATSASLWECNLRRIEPPRPHDR